MSARPIALTCGRRPAELGERHRQPSAQRAAWTAIVRDSRLRGQARARQHAHGATTNQLTESRSSRPHPSTQYALGRAGRLRARDSWRPEPAPAGSAASKSPEHHRHARPAASNELTGPCSRDQQTFRFIPTASRCRAAPPPRARSAQRPSTITDVSRRRVPPPDPPRAAEGVTSRATGGTTEAFARAVGGWEKERLVGERRSPCNATSPDSVPADVTIRLMRNRHVRPTFWLRPGFGVVASSWLA